MKQLIFVAIFFAAFACKARIQSANTTQDSTPVSYTTPDTLTIAGEWKLMPVLASDTATGKIPYLKFDLKTNRFSGNTGCNSMGGNFEIKKDALRFGNNIISTKMACPGYNEQPFLDNLLKTNHYEIKDGVLQLMYNTTILSKWTRHLNTNPTKQI